MQIIVNPGPIAAGDELSAMVERKVGPALDRFSAWLTRVEVHLEDENGQKGGVDKRVSMEARPRGHQPIAVNADAPTFEAAIAAALTKLKNALEHTAGKMSS